MLEEEVIGHITQQKLKLKALPQGTTYLVLWFKWQVGK